MNTLTGFRASIAALLVAVAAGTALAAPQPGTAPQPDAVPRPDAGARPGAGAPAVGVPVQLSRQPRTWMDEAARKLTAQDLGEARRAGEVPLILVGSARLSATPSDRAALFVQLQSPRECGSAGCSTMVFLWRNGQWTRVLDGVGGRVTVARTRTKGMADLFSDGERYVWTGTAYVDASPAPAVDLRPRR